METIQTFKLEAGGRKLAKGGWRPLCEHAGHLATWALGAKEPRAQMLLPCCVGKAQRKRARKD